MIPKLIDTHAHLDAVQFDDDRADVIERAVNSGIEKIIIPAISPDRFPNLIELCATYDCLYCGIGIHPHDTKDTTFEELRLVEEFSHKSKVVAIGEIGLDYFYDFSPRAKQQEVFREQLRIAKQRGLPVIVHNRESDDDILQIIEQEQDGTLRGVLHCFSSGLETLKRTLDLGFNVSYTGNITHKKSTLNDVVRNTPLDRLMVETDSPYIAPVPHRGKRNEPQNVRSVAEKIAELHEISIEEVALMTTNTAMKFFKLVALFALTVSLTITVSLYESHAQTVVERSQRSDRYEPTSRDSLDEHPYPKWLGMGGFLGPITIVETRKGDPREIKAGKDYTISKPGIGGVGASLNYFFSDRLMIDFSFASGTDKSPIRDSVPDPIRAGQYIYSGFQLDPYVHTVGELTAKYIFNPYSRIGFYVIGGAVVFQSSYTEPTRLQDTLGTLHGSVVSFGFSTGLGIIANIRTPYGVVSPWAEWRIDFDFNETLKPVYDINQFTGERYVGTSLVRFFSIPRFGISLYPEF